MKSKTTPSLIISLILTVSYMSHIHAVTDAELEALEKQIEQLETDEKNQAEAAEKKKAEAAAKRIADQKRKANAEVEQKRLAELEKQRLEEEKRLAEETKKREEEEKKNKYAILVSEAQRAVTNKDKEMAIIKYNEALILVPGDYVANMGIKTAKELKHKVCYEVLGTWVFDSWLRNADSIEIKGDGTYTYETTTKSIWKCIDPENRTIELHANMSIPLPASTMTAVLSNDGQCLNISSFSGKFILNRPGHICGIVRQ